MTEEICGKPCEVYSRIVGYFRPVQNWNAGKQEEFRQRLEFSEAKALKSDFSKIREQAKQEAVAAAK